jgi:inosine/xanthosine triphosphatase
MKVVVGSKNPNKVNAVLNILKTSDCFPDLEIASDAMPSGVREQPLSLEETIEGAMNRAKGAFHDCDYSVGIESGLMLVPHTKSGYMNIIVCALYDGSAFHLGTSNAFEFPPKVVECAIKEEIMIDEAFHKLGLTEDPRIGYSRGISHVITRGRSDRQENVEQAVRMALIHIENKEWYS